jgi:hypothetical protein
MTKRIDLRADGANAMRLTLPGPGGLRVTAKPLASLLAAAEQGVAIRRLMSIKTIEQVEPYLGLASDARPEGVVLRRLEARVAAAGRPPLLERLRRRANYVGLISTLLDHVQFAQKVLFESNDVLVQAELEIFNDADSSSRHAGRIVSAGPRYKPTTYEAIAGVIARPDVRRVVTVGELDVGVMQRLCEEQLKRYAYPRRSLKALSSEWSALGEEFLVCAMDMRSRWGGEASWNCEPGDEVDPVSVVPAWMSFVSWMGEGPSYGDLVIDDHDGIGDAALLSKRFKVVAQLRPDYQEIKGAQVILRNEECLVFSLPGASGQR